MRIPALFLGGVLIAGCPASKSDQDDNRAASAAPAEKSGEPAVAEPQAAPEEHTLATFTPTDVVLDHEVKTLEGESKKLSDYRGKALLVVNTASECGFTPQYADLQKLYATYHDRGLEVLAFPSNDFGEQEPGDASKIRTFVDETYDVEFPMFDKVHTKGAEQAPIYKTLTEETGDGIKGEVKWNFTKFLVDPQGRVVARFEPPVTPTDPKVVAALEQVLPKT